MLALGDVPAAGLHVGTEELCFLLHAGVFAGTELQSLKLPCRKMKPCFG